MPPDDDPAGGFDGGGFVRVLVTGGAGFIGSHLCEGLLAAGHAVRTLDDLSVGRRENVPAGCAFVRGSVLDEGVLAEAMEGVEAVFHEAARVTVRGSMDAYVDDAETNLLGALKTLRAAHRAGVKRFVFASSMAVYADSPDATPVTESHPLAPTSPYGVTKLAAERELLLLGPHLGVETVALRYFNAFGPRQAFTPYVGVATIFVTQLLAGEALTVYGDGGQTRDFVHVSDIVQANRLALTAPGAAGQVINVGSGRGTTVRALAEGLTARLRPGAPWRHVPARAEEIRHSVADLTRARSVLGYAPTTDIDAQIDGVIASVRGSS